MTENWKFRSPFRIANVITALGFIPPCVAASTVVVHPGMNIQNLVDASPSGTNYLIQPGIHRLQTIKAKHGDIFQGVPGAVLNGSMIVTGFVRESSFWAASVTVPKLPRGTVPCLSGGNECQYPEDL